MVTSLEFERIMNAAGPTKGQLVRPSDGKHPHDDRVRPVRGLPLTSQDAAKGKPYCSKICCMYTAKHAMLVREKYPDVKVHVFYIDVRTPGKNFDEFYRRAVEQYDVDYIKGMVGKVSPWRAVMLHGSGQSDLLANEQVHIRGRHGGAGRGHRAGSHGPRHLATMLTASMDTNDFFTEAHPKLRPVESPTAGIFLSGVCQGPKDIPETVAQAGAAAAKVIGLLSQEYSLTCNPCVAHADELLCNGCSAVRAASAPTARSPMRTRKFAMPRPYRGVQRVAMVNEAVCQGCGACTVTCPSGAMDLKGFTQQPDHGGGGCDMPMSEKKEFRRRPSWRSAATGAAMRARIWRAPAASTYPANVKIIRVPCSCRVNPLFMLRAFQRGADGVILCGCHPGDCHYTTGNYYARRRMTLLFSMLDYLGIERGRTRVEWVSAAEGAKFAATMNDFAKTITELGENKRLEDLRCKEMIAKPRASELLAENGPVDRVLGWEAGEICLRSSRRPFLITTEHLDGLCSTTPSARAI